MMSTTAATPAPELPEGWRFRLGVICFVLAFGVHLVTLGAAALGASAGTVAAIAGANFAINKILLVATIGLLGKSGFNYLKSAAFGVVGRYAPAQTVGPVRYRIGLVLFVIPVLFGWLSPYLAGMIPELVTRSVAFGVAGDLLLLVSLLVLGGDFWDKIRSLFVREAKVQFPPTDVA
jgi:hypothetical protein